MQLFNGTESPNYSNEEYTPIDIYNPLGPFDFDPCAGVGTSIGVKENWTKDDDGLFAKIWPKDWFGFVNPPFSLKNEVIDLCHSHGNNILLLPFGAYAEWQSRLYRLAGYKFEIGKRICFESSKRGKAPAKFSTVLIPFGTLALERIKKSGLKGELSMLLL